METFTYNHRRAEIPHVQPGQAPSLIQPHVVPLTETPGPHIHIADSRAGGREITPGNAPNQQGQSGDREGQGSLLEKPPVQNQQASPSLHSRPEGYTGNNVHEGSITGPKSDDQTRLSGLGAPKEHLHIKGSEKGGMYWENSSELVPQSRKLEGYNAKYDPLKTMDKYNGSDGKLCKAKATSTALARRQPMFRGSRADPSEQTDSVVSAVASAEAEGKA